MQYGVPDVQKSVSVQGMDVKMTFGQHQPNASKEHPNVRRGFVLLYEWVHVGQNDVTGASPRRRMDPTPGRRSLNVKLRQNDSPIQKKDPFKERLEQSGGYNVRFFFR